MFFYTTEMNVQLVQVLKKSSKRCALSHLSKSIYILGEALATISKFTIGAGNIGMGIINIT